MGGGGCGVNGQASRTWVHNVLTPGLHLHSMLYDDPNDSDHALDHASTHT